MSNVLFKQMQKRNVKIYGKGKVEPLLNIFLNKIIKTLPLNGLRKLFSEYADHCSLTSIKSFHLTLPNTHQSS